VAASWTLGSKESLCYPAGTLDSKTTPLPAREDQPPMTAIPDTAEPPDHPLHALTTFELRNYRRRLETAIALASSQDSAAPVRAALQARLRDVQAEQRRPRKDRPCLTITAPGSPSSPLANWTGTRISSPAALKPWTLARRSARASSMSWQRSAPNKIRARTGQPARPHRHYDAAGLTAGELERTRRELATSPGTARLTRTRADPGTNGRHRR